jgi:hypothetical protein
VRIASLVVIAKVVFNIDLEPISTRLESHGWGYPT